MRALSGKLRRIGNCYLKCSLAVARAFLYASLRDGKASDPVLLMKKDTMVHYTPSGGGRVLFVRDNNLYAQKLNVAKRTLEAEPELLERGVASAPEFVLPLISVSRSDAVVWRSGGMAASQLVTFDRQGRQVGTTGPPLSTSMAVLSPDEKHMLVLGALLEPDRPGREGRDGLADLRSSTKRRSTSQAAGRVASRAGAGLRKNSERLVTA